MDLAYLASLPKLKILNLDNNEFIRLPLLKMNSKNAKNSNHVEDTTTPNKESDVTACMSFEKESEGALRNVTPMSRAVTDLGLGECISAVKDKPATASGVYGEFDHQETIHNRSLIKVSKSKKPIAKSVKQQLNRISSSKSKEDCGSPGSYSSIPFPSLTKLMIKNNEIEKDEDLLPAAVWPSLRELDVRGNPICRKYAGVPPLVKKILVDTYQIALKRDCRPVQPMVPKCGPVLNNSMKNGRKVDCTVPKFPPCDIEKLIEDVRSTQLGMLDDQRKKFENENGENQNDLDLSEKSSLHGELDNRSYISEISQSPSEKEESDFGELSDELDNGVFVTQEENDCEEESREQPEEEFTFNFPELSWNINESELPTSVKDCVSELKKALKNPPLLSAQKINEKITQGDIESVSSDQQAIVEKFTSSVNLSKAIVAERRTLQKNRLKMSSAVGFGERSESQQLKIQKERFAKLTDSQRERWLKKQDEKKIQPSWLYKEMEKVYKNVKSNAVKCANESLAEEKNRIINDLEHKIDSIDHDS